jgi:hypothetical protein
MEHVILTTAVFALGFAAMAVGVILQGRKKALKGSCGGVASNPDCCMSCDKPEDERCDHGKELGKDTRALSEELAHVAGKSTGDHPALGQVQ